MKIIVDTNVVFSALVNTQSRIADLLLNSEGTFAFYSCHLLTEEIDRHWAKLLDLSTLGEAELKTAQRQVFSAIEFISEELFPFSIWQSAIPMVRDVDMDDVAFVALTEYLNGSLWTGDRKLIEGLAAKGYSKLVTTQELVNIRRTTEQG